MCMSVFVQTLKPGLLLLVVVLVLLVARAPGDLLLDDLLGPLPDVMDDVLDDVARDRHVASRSRERPRRPGRGH